MRWRGLASAVIVLLVAACSPQRGPDPLSSLGRPECDPPNETLVLLAQTVQTATRLPCVAGLPAGWRYAGSDLRRGSATYWLSSAVLGSQAVEVQLVPSCGVAGERFPLEGSPDITAYVSTDGTGETRTFVFEGGCILERISYAPDVEPSVRDQARSALGFLDRATFAAALERDYDVVLCGAGASPCVGG